LQEEFIVSKENSVIGTFKEVSSESLGLDFGLNTGYEKRVLLLFEDWLFVLVVLFFKGQFKTWCSEEPQYKQRFSFLLLSFSSGVKGSWVRLEHGLKELVEFGLLLNENSLKIIIIKSKELFMGRESKVNTRSYRLKFKERLRSWEHFKNSGNNLIMKSI